MFYNSPHTDRGLGKDVYVCVCVCGGGGGGGERGVGVVLRPLGVTIRIVGMPDHNFILKLHPQVVAHLYHISETTKRKRIGQTVCVLNWFLLLVISCSCLF